VMKSKLLRTFILAVLVVSIVCPFTHAAESVSSTKTSGKENPSSQPAFLVADFEKSKLVTLADTPWNVFTDSVLAGKSSLNVSVTSSGAGNSKGAMLLTGKLSPDFQWGGFAGITAMLQKGGATTNLSQFTGVQFLARGDGKTYRVLVGK